MSIQAEKLNPSFTTYFDKKAVLLKKFNLLKFIKKIFTITEVNSTSTLSNTLRDDIGLPRVDRQHHNFMLYGKDLPEIETRRRW